MSRPTASTSSDSPKGETSYVKKLTQSFSRGHSDVGHPDIFMVPMGVPESKNGMYCSYNFGEKCWDHKSHKVIMLVGATGTGKSTLINAMTNYILGVKWEDDFRFKLVDEHVSGVKSQAHSQTQMISSYTIYRNKHHQISYTLTIIDTPGFGDTRGIERDKAIVKQIREFFSHPEAHGVDHIDAIGFVVQASQARLTPTQRYMFESTLSLFGKDITSNNILLVNFWDGSEPAVLAAIKEADFPYSGHVFVFNNAALFGKNKENKAESDSDEEEVNPLKLYWQNGMKETKRFFKTVSELEERSLFLSKGVLDTRKRLEQKVEGLQSQSDIYRDRIGELRKEQEVLERCQREIEGNKSFEYEAEVIEDEKIASDVGVLNCDNCKFTCHYPCKPPDKQKRKCHMIDKDGNCMVCPGRCTWNAHLIQNYRHVYTEKKQMKTFDDIEKRYRNAEDKKLTVEEVIVKLISDIEDLKQSNAGLILEIYQDLQGLEGFASRPHLIGLNEYIDSLIERERNETKIGWQTRVKTLESYKGQQGLLDSLKSGINKTWHWIVRKVKTD